MSILWGFLIVFALLLGYGLFNAIRGITQQKATGLGAAHPLIRPYAERFLRKRLARRGIHP
jgi:hypothetical protein